MAPPPAKDKRPRDNKDKPRLDVSTPATALKHNPFAALAGSAPASAASGTNAVDAAPTANLAPAASAASAASAARDAKPAQITPTANAAATPRPAASPAPKAAEAKKSRGRLILRRETKHRGGKTVVIVAGFAQLPGISDRELEELLQLLKQRLGCGGAVLARELLLQGDRPAQLAALLRDQGFRVDGVTS